MGRSPKGKQAGMSGYAGQGGPAPLPDRLRQEPCAAPPPEARDAANGILYRRRMEHAWPRGKRLKKLIAAFVLLAPFLPHSALAQQVQAAEKLVPYAVSGSSAIELYRSIGERGPKSRNGRAIALTDYRLTWTRKYVPEGGTCRLTTAVPHLTLITHLPKPSGRLPARTETLWNTFIAGITAHERVHGEIIRKTVDAIRSATEGLTVSGDPSCRKIRTEVTKRVAALADEMRRRNRDFDQVEMGKGGNVQQLILTLVNGDRE
jgi:predicted secreted Zn-dependent protease